MTNSKQDYTAAAIVGATSGTIVGAAVLGSALLLSRRINKSIQGATERLATSLERTLPQTATQAGTALGESLGKSLIETAAAKAKSGIKKLVDLVKGGQEITPEAYAAMYSSEPEDSKTKAGMIGAAAGFGGGFGLSWLINRFRSPQKATETAGQVTELPLSIFLPGERGGTKVEVALAKVSPKVKGTIAKTREVLSELSRSAIRVKKVIH